MLPSSLNLMAVTPYQGSFKPTSGKVNRTLVGEVMTDMSFRFPGGEDFVIVSPSIKRGHS